MRVLITLQLMGLAFTNIILLAVSGIDVSLGVALMPVLITYAAAALLFAGAKVRWYGVGSVAAYMLAVFLWRFGQSRPTSILYSLLVLAFFAAIMNVMHRWYTREHFVSTLQWIIVAFFANVVCAQLLQVTGTAGHWTELIFQTNIDPRYDAVRYQGFSSEPSYAAFIVIVAYVAVHRIGVLSHTRQAALFGMLLYMIYAFQSLYGYLMIAPAIVAAHWRQIVYRRKLAISLAAIVCAGLLAIPGWAAPGRVGKILEAASEGTLFDVQTLRAVDGSTFIRVGTFLEYLLLADYTDSEVIFGHGAMSHMYSLGWQYRDRIAVNDTFNEHILRPGFTIGFVYDYGLVGALMVLVFVYKVAVRRLLSIESLLILLMLFNANFNTLLFWCLVTVFAAGKMYEREAACAERSALALRAGVTWEAVHAHRG